MACKARNLKKSSYAFRAFRARWEVEEGAEKEDVASLLAHAKEEAGCYSKMANPRVDPAWQLTDLNEEKDLLKPMMNMVNRQI